MYIPDDLLRLALGRNSVRESLFASHYFISAQSYLRSKWQVYELTYAAFLERGNSSNTDTVNLFYCRQWGWIVMMLNCLQTGVFAGSAEVMGEGLCEMQLNARYCGQSGQRPTSDTDKLWCSWRCDKTPWVQLQCPTEFDISLSLSSLR